MVLRIRYGRTWWTKKYKEMNELQKPLALVVSDSPLGRHVHESLSTRRSDWRVTLVDTSLLTIGERTPSVESVKFDVSHDESLPIAAIIVCTEASLREYAPNFSPA